MSSEHVSIYTNAFWVITKAIALLVGVVMMFQVMRGEIKVNSMRIDRLEAQVTQQSLELKAIRINTTRTANDVDWIRGELEKMTQ